MKRAVRLALLLAAAVPARLAAQETPAPPGVEILRGDDGTVMSLDTSTVTRLRPGVFSVRREVRFAAAVALPTGEHVDREVDTEELDCAGGRSRAVFSRLFARDSLVRDTLLVRDARADEGWAAVPEEQAAAFRATCDALRPFDRHEYDASVVEQQPVLANASTLVSALQREYPRELRDQHVAGTVAIRMRVLADGTVERGSMSVEQTTDPAFNQAALRVARQARFRPASVHKHPVAVWVVQPFQFEAP
jgi:TonB family protein